MEMIYFHLWMVFLAIIKLEYHHKITFIFPWGTFAYRKLPFGLKNVGTSFQWAMFYVFHNIKHIVEVYLYDLIARSLICEDRPTHLQEVFLRCHYYKIWLNLHKCVFCV